MAKKPIEASDALKRIAKNGHFNRQCIKRGHHPQGCTSGIRRNDFQSFPDKFHLYLQSYFSTFICKVTFPDKAVFM